MQSKDESYIHVGDDSEHSKAIISDMLKGHHIFNGPEFSELKRNKKFYSKLFSLMDLELVHHDMDFFYLMNRGKKPGSNATSISLLFFVLMRSISTTDNDSSPEILRHRGFERRLLRIDDLSSNDRALLEESGMSSDDEVTKVLKQMERLGFITRYPEEGIFVFNKPAFRLIELCDAILLEDSVDGVSTEEE